MSSTSGLHAGNPTSEENILTELRAGRRRSLKRLRTRRRRNDAKLNRNQVFAAHKLYWDGGLSIPELAAKLGLADSTLYRTFDRHGLRIRSKSEATRLTASTKTCAGCAHTLETQTPRCHTCASRAHHRRKRAQHVANVVPLRETRTCVGCRCPLDEETRGCRACVNRMNERRRRAA